MLQPGSTISPSLYYTSPIFLIVNVIFWNNIFSDLDSINLKLCLILSSIKESSSLMALLTNGSKLLFKSSLLMSVLSWNASCSLIAVFSIVLVSSHYSIIFILLGISTYTTVFSLSKLLWYPNSLTSSKIIPPWEIVSLTWEGKTGWNVFLIILSLEEVLKNDYDDFLKVIIYY